VITAPSTSSFDLLSFLKYAGFVVSALSTIWGLVAKTSFEDEQYRKRLTDAGQTSIAITVTPALMLAFGFYSAAQRAKALQEKQERNASDQRARAIERAAADAVVFTGSIHQVGASPSI